MSIVKTPMETTIHKDKALGVLDNFLSGLIASGDPALLSKAEKISYWIEDYSKYLAFETSFKPESLKAYDRGDILKVDLGFNIGSEQGGLHYAVIVGKNNSLYGRNVQIVPLTSVKPQKDVSHLPAGQIYIGNEIFNSLIKDISTRLDAGIRESDDLKTISELISKELDAGPDDDKISDPENRLEEVKRRLSILGQETKWLGKAHKEVMKMKKGSIALVSQITTISKIRIVDPRTCRGILNKVRLSSSSLDAIDKGVLEVLTGGK